MSSPFNTQNAPNGAEAPASDCFVVTPNDSEDLARPARAFYAQNEGDIRVTTYEGNVRTIPIGAFMPLPLAITRVHATGTTATGIVALTG